MTQLLSTRLVMFISFVVLAPILTPQLSVHGAPNPSPSPPIPIALRAFSGSSVPLSRAEAHKHNITANALIFGGLEIKPDENVKHDASKLKHVLSPLGEGISSLITGICTTASFECPKSTTEGNPLTTCVVNVLGGLECSYASVKALKGRSGDGNEGTTFCEYHPIAGTLVFTNHGSSCPTQADILPLLSPPVSSSLPSSPSPSPSTSTSTSSSSSDSTSTSPTSSPSPIPAPGSEGEDPSAQNPSLRARSDAVAVPSCGAHSHEDEDDIKTIGPMNERDSVDEGESSSPHCDMPAHAYTKRGMTETLVARIVASAFGIRGIGNDDMGGQSSSDEQNNSPSYDILIVNKRDSGKSGNTGTTGNVTVPQNTTTISSSNGNDTFRDTDY